MEENGLKTNGYALVEEEYETVSKFLNSLLGKEEPLEKEELEFAWELLSIKFGNSFWWAMLKEQEGEGNQFVEELARRLVKLSEEIRSKVSGFNSFYLQHFFANLSSFESFAWRYFQ